MGQSAVGQGGNLQLGGTLSKRIGRKFGDQGLNQFQKYANKVAGREGAADVFGSPNRSTFGMAQARKAQDAGLLSARPQIAAMLEHLFAGKLGNRREGQPPVDPNVGPPAGGRDRGRRRPMNDIPYGDDGVFMPQEVPDDPMGVMAPPNPRPDVIPPPVPNPGPVVAPTDIRQNQELEMLRWLQSFLPQGGQAVNRPMRGGF